MRRHQLQIPILIAILFCGPAWSTSVEEARQLHQVGKTEEALAAIENLLASGADAVAKAAALDLLGTIAVDEGQLAMAKQAWSRLLDEYPDHAGAHDTATKLRLVSALLMTEEEAVEGAPAARQTVEAAPADGERADAMPEGVVEPALTPVAAPSEPPRDVAPASPVTRSSGRVLVAARGKPHDAIRELSDRIVAHLREKGVDAESATGGIPVVEESKMVLPMLLQKGQQDAAGSVLLLTADFVSMQKVVLDCYTPAGAELWKIKVSGGTGWKGRPYTKSGITEELAARFMQKLDKKVGQPGLPISFP